MIYVLGGEGQLGQCLQKFEEVEPLSIDITNLNLLESEFSRLKEGSTIVNCAAYTNVDGAEDNVTEAFEVNSNGAENVAKACLNNKLKLIHISTDYVFDGASKEAYKETDATNPISVYGKSKLEGEQKISKVFSDYIIIRTSWLYSEFGKNFLKTMLSLKDRNELNVVNDQYGTPTNANDLAAAIIKLALTFDDVKSETFHFSNSGKCSWYDFAVEIFKQEKADIKVNPIGTDGYPTKATRPKNSELSKEKISKIIKIRDWKESLSDVMRSL